MRARAYKTAAAPPRIATRTFIFPGDVKRQTKPKDRLFPTFTTNEQVMDYEMDPAITTGREYGGRIVDSLLSIPSVSLVTDHRNLFDLRAGIYVHPLDKGNDWERPVSVEFLFPGAEAP